LTFETLAPDRLLEGSQVVAFGTFTEQTHLVNKFPARDRFTARYSSVSGARAQFSNPHVPVGKYPRTPRNHYSPGYRTRKFMQLMGELCSG